MKKEKYYKIHLGYDKEISIREKDLPRAVYAQITGDLLVLDSASVVGSSITLIEPDYHKAMGFNEGYKLQAEDWKYINRDCADYKGTIEQAKQIVQTLRQSNQITKLSDSNCIYLEDFVKLLPVENC